MYNCEHVGVVLSDTNILNVTFLLYQIAREQGAGAMFSKLEAAIVTGSGSSASKFRGHLGQVISYRLLIPSHGAIPITP